MVDLSKINTSMRIPKGKTLGVWYLENPIWYWIKINIFGNKFFYPIIKKIHAYVLARIINLIENKKTMEKTVELVNNETDSDYSVDSEFGYGVGDRDVATRELQCLLGYRDEIANGLGTKQSESDALYTSIVDKISIFIEKNDVKSFFNMGVAYPYVDCFLATKFPDVQFYGIERTILPKLYNEYEFGHNKNMHFLAGDMFEFFKKMNFKGGIFFHARTMLLLPKKFVEKAYTKAKEAGFKYIIGFEQYGISRQTGQSYELSYDDKDSVVYRKHMILHNYPGILTKTGFELKTIDLVKTGHPHADFRILSFFAKAQ